jgi:hypothetical protein
VSDVAVPGRLFDALASPQLTVYEEMVPSGSVAEKVTVTIWVVVAGLGRIVEMVTAGGRSLTVSVAVADPRPALLVAVTLIVNV